MYNAHMATKIDKKDKKGKKMRNKYKAKYASKMLEDYLETCEDEEKEEIVQENKEKGYVMHRKVLKVHLPTVEGFSKFIKVTRSTVYFWAKTYPEFSEALDRIKAEQLQKLIARGLEGKYNPTIVKLILSTNHGMVEKTDVTSDGKPLNNLSDEQIRRIAQRVARGSAGDGNPSGETKPN